MRARYCYVFAALFYLTNAQASEWCGIKGLVKSGNGVSFELGGGDLQILRRSETASTRLEARRGVLFSGAHRLAKLELQRNEIAYANDDISRKYCVIWIDQRISPETLIVEEYNYATVRLPTFRTVRMLVGGNS